MNSAIIKSAAAWLCELDPTAKLRLITDSRKIQSGDVFIAYPGEKSDGRAHIAQAISAGARAIVIEQKAYQETQLAVPYLCVPDLQWNAGFIAAEYLDGPDQNMLVVAVTGTNGKTSCTQWLARALSLVKHADTVAPACVIGTLGVATVSDGTIGDIDVTGYTTPDAIQLQQHLARQRDLGVTSAAIEATSIGLVQGRMNGMHVNIAAFTNLTRDHLDFHGTMEQYEVAKQKLFDWQGLQSAVINIDDPAGVRLVEYCVNKGLAVIAYGIDDIALPSTLAGKVKLLKASNVKNLANGTSFQVDSPLGDGVIKSRMIGRFNVSNVLLVLGVLLAKKLSWADAVQAIEQLTPVAGRMEQLSASGRVMVVIDYAHTPDALEKTMQNLVDVARERQGKLWCVFGCGGDRDPGKRPIMGGIAELGDEIVVTSDNPRNEDPDQIIAQIVAGITPGRTPAPVVEPDRAKAILYAIKNAAKNDVVLIAGKGHETYQEIKGKKLLFSDVDHANIALASLASKGVGI